MRGAPHKGLAWRMRRIRSRMFAATSGLPGKAAGFPGPMPGESSAVPTEDRVGLNHLETSPPTGPESVQHNPQEPVAAVEAQATRRVLWKTASWWRSARISACREARVRKLEANKAKRAERELIVATMISRMSRTSVFSDRMGFSVATAWNSSVAKILSRNSCCGSRYRRKVNSSPSSPSFVLRSPEAFPLVQNW